MSGANDGAASGGADGVVARLGPTERTSRRRFRMPAGSMGEVRVSSGAVVSVRVVAIGPAEATLVECGGGSCAAVEPGPASLVLPERSGGHRRSVTGVIRRVTDRGPLGPIEGFRFDEPIDPSVFSHEAWLTERLVAGVIEPADVIRLAAAAADVVGTPGPGAAVGEPDGVDRGAPRLAGLRAAWSLLDDAGTVTRRG